MDEQKEKKEKTILLYFIKDNFEFEGEPDKVQEKLFNLTDKLYKLVKEKLSTV